MNDIILASASPRRALLLQNLGLRFITRASDIIEEHIPGETPADMVKRIARQKALEAASFFDSGVIIGADTIVVQNDKIMGKPTNEAEAFAMLSFLSGRTHQVLTGICINNLNNGNCESEVEETRVYFRSLDPDEIISYIQTGEAMDKAGAYGIQGKAALFVSRIEGCYFNVVGLPLNRLGLMLKKQGIDLLG